MCVELSRCKESNFWSTVQFEHQRQKIFNSEQLESQQRILYHAIVRKLKHIQNYFTFFYELNISINFESLRYACLHVCRSF